jgi:hypothetical protein
MKIILFLFTIRLLIVVCDLELVHSFKNNDISKQKHVNFHYLSKKVFNEGLRLPKSIFGVEFQEGSLFYNNSIAPSKLFSEVVEDVTYLKENFKVSELHRLSYINRLPTDIWQGSYMVDLPLSILSYLSKLQHKHEITGTVGEIGVN